MTSGSWPFHDAPNVATITMRQIMAGEEAIDRVWHDQEDGQWQFLSSRLHFNTGDAMLVTLQSVAMLDSTILELHDLPMGWEAWRSSIGEPWQRAITDSD